MKTKLKTIGLCHVLGIPATPKNSLRSKIANSKHLTVEELKGRILNIWEENFSKIDRFWSELELHKNNALEELVEKEETLNNQEALLKNERERLEQLINENVETISNAIREENYNLFKKRFNDLIADRISPDKAATLADKYASIPIKRKIINLEEAYKTLEGNGYSFHNDKWHRISQIFKNKDNEIIMLRLKCEEYVFPKNKCEYTENLEVVLNDSNNVCHCTKPDDDFGF